MGVRTFPDVRRAYVDFDGTCADFTGAASANGMTPKEYKLVPGAYRNLALMPGTIAALNELTRRGFQVWGLTKLPADNPYSATEKLLWQRETAPIFGERVIMSPDKGAVGSPRDLLIDDMPGWANANAFPGTIIPFTSWADVLANPASQY